MKLEFTDKDSEYLVGFGLDGQSITMSRTDRFSTNGKYACCGWGGLYEECPYFSEEARAFIDRALKLKAFW